MEGLQLGEKSKILGRSKFSGNCSQSQKDTTDTVSNEITVCHLWSCSSLYINVVIGNIKLRAVVDTAAEVTIISDRVYQSMDPKPRRIKNITLKAAGRDMSMPGFIMDQSLLKIGTKNYYENIYVAPIEQDMLLGADFLNKHKAVLFMGVGKMVIDGLNIRMERVGEKEGEIPEVASVKVNKRIVVPPKSVVLVKCELDNELKQDYFMEKVDSLDLMLPRTVCRGSSRP